MSKNNFYFSHDGNSRNDEKILAVRMKLGAEGYGIYFMLLERLLESDQYTLIKDYNVIAFDLRVASAKIKSVVEDFGLFQFTEDGKRFYSEGLINRMKPLENLRKQRSEAGKKSAEKRKMNDRSTTDEEKSNETQILLPKNSTEKVKESKVNNISFLEKKKQKREIDTREGENFSQEDFSCDETSSLNSEEEKKEKSSAKKEKKFTPPRVEEVRSYCEERQNGISAEAFCNFYQSKGWMIGKNKMKDWKASVRTWEQKRKEDGTNKQQSANSGQPTANGYQQRATTGTNRKISAHQMFARELDRATAQHHDSENITIQVEAHE